jgi:predicted dehydrogenase
MLRVGIIGFGYWGPNLARNVYAHPNMILNAIADKRPEKREAAIKAYHGVELYEEAKSVISSKEIDVVVIATSVDQHCNLAKAALLEGKHVLVEKPAGASYNHLLELHNLALSKKLVLMVDYTFLYNGAVKKLFEIVNQDAFGKINYIDSTRINLGIFQNDVNVIWDLASHDIAIVNYLTGKSPVSVKADGISHTKNGIENIAYITLKYQDDLIVHLNCSWTSPVKIRQMLIGGDKKMLMYNDIEPTDKIKIYDCNFNFNSNKNREKLLVDYRLGDITIPKFDTKEPLASLIDDLYESVTLNKTPLSSSHKALYVSKILEAAQESIKSGGVETLIANNILYASN